MDSRRLGATDLLARLLATTPDPFGLGTAASIEPLGEHGVRSEIELPTGDRYRVSVEWIGDREAASADSGDATAALRVALKAAEWGGAGSTCPACSAARADGHNAGCVVAVALWLEEAGGS